MKRKTILIFMAVVTLTCFGCSKKASVPEKDVINAETDFEVALTDDGEGVVIKSYIGKSEKVIIPDTIQGMPVREILDAFGWSGGYSNSISFAWSDEDNAKTKKITKIVIPEGVIKIGLISNENIVSVTLPSSLKSIRGFEGCKALTSVELPASITEIGVGFFKGCKALTSINIPAGVTKIGEGAFYGTGLTSFPASLSKGITVIPENAFSFTDISGDLVIPEGITTISDKAFISCKNITSLTLPSTIKEIQQQVFADCELLTTVNIPDSVKKIAFVFRQTSEWTGTFVMSMSTAFINCPKLDLKSQATLKRVGYDFD